MQWKGLRTTDCRHRCWHSDEDAVTTTAAAAAAAAAEDQKDVLPRNDRALPPKNNATPIRLISATDTKRRVPIFPSFLQYSITDTKWALAQIRSKLNLVSLKLKFSSTISATKCDLYSRLKMKIGCPRSLYSISVTSPFNFKLSATGVA